MMTDNDLRDLLKNINFLRYILTECQYCGYFDNVHQADPLQTAYANGQRSVAVRLMNRVKALDFGAYLKILALEQEKASE